MHDHAALSGHPASGLVGLSDLLDALEGQTTASQLVIESWAKGDLAAAVRALDASIQAAHAAIVKAKGGG